MIGFGGIVTFRVLSVFALVLCLCAGAAQAAAVSYTIDFTGGGSDITSIGQGSFSYDSLGMTNTTIGPPVTLTNYMVPVVFGDICLDSIGPSVCITPISPATITPPVIFTQTSPDDDSVVLNGSGLVTALAVDSTNSSFTLQLFSDNSWTVTENPPVNMTVPVQFIGGNGTYTVSPTSAIPEPLSMGLVVAGLFGLFLRRRKHVW